MYPLGRRHAPDVRDQRHPMAAALPTVLPVRPKSKVYRIWWSGDQGETSECVGYSWHALLRAHPRLQREPDPHTIFLEARKVDEWDGEDYLGTSVRAAAKVLQAQGKIVAYSWADRLEIVLNHLAFVGPVVLGTDWHEQMFRPGPTGLVELGGPVVGGHAYVVLGYDDRTRLLICQNSWGKDYGVRGRFLLRYEDADRLIQAQGEACAPTEPTS